MRRGLVLAAATVLVGLTWLGPMAGASPRYGGGVSHEATTGDGLLGQSGNVALASALATSKPPPNNGNDVYFRPDMSALPMNTKIAYSFLKASSDSNCVLRPRSVAVPGVVPEEDESFYAFATDASSVPPCSLSASFGQLKVTITLPNGLTEWTVARLQQIPPLTVFSIFVLGWCTSQGNLDCTGGSDSATGSSNVIVPMTFGPLQTGPAGYTFCAGEGDQCQFSGTRTVAYGANGRYNYDMNATSPVFCRFGGDPAPGVKKACFVQNA